MTVNDLLDKKIDLNFLSSSKKTIAANGSMYRTDIKGILPQIIEKEYNDRVTYKRKMLEA